MTKITNIDCPKEWEITNDFGSHLPMLWLMLENTIGDVVEMGCGDNSTQKLHDYCVKNKRQFYSYDTNKEWLKKYRELVIPLDDYDEIFLLKFGLLFVDLAPASQRKEIIHNHANSSDVILAHDSEPGAEFCYGMSEVLNSFKYRLDFKPEGMPHSTAVSNFINIAEWI